MYVIDGPLLCQMSIYIRILTGNDMYCLGGPLVCQLSICQNPNRKLYVLPRWSTCLPIVYMLEHLQEMTCIA